MYYNAPLLLIYYYISTSSVPYCLSHLYICVSLSTHYISLLRLTIGTVSDSWSCSTDPAAFKRYRKELLHLLTDVCDVGDPIKESVKRERRSSKPEGRSHAGFSYFTNVLLQEVLEETLYKKVSQ